MTRLWIIALVLLTWGAAVSAGPAPDTSLRPVLRAGDAPVQPASNVMWQARLSTSGAVRPIARPAMLEGLPRARAVPDQVWPARVSPRGAARAPTSDDLAVQTPGVIETSAAVRSLRPNLRPSALVEKAMAQQRQERAGRLAGIQGVQGDIVGEVPGKGRCGIATALRVTHVSGIALNPPALMDKQTAQALKTWVDTGLKPAVGSVGGGVASMRVAAHYVCRTRNHQPGARLSEHSFGKAIDLSVFTLRDGDTIILSRDWGGGPKGRALREMHRAACGPFGTVLGPESDRWHRDHFHFDTARHGNGPYCR